MLLKHLMQYFFLNDVFALSQTEGKEGIPFHLPKTLVEKKWRYMYHLGKRVEELGRKRDKKAFHMQLSIEIICLKLI